MRKSWKAIAVIPFLLVAACGDDESGDGTDEAVESTAEESGDGTSAEQDGTSEEQDDTSGSAEESGENTSDADAPETTGESGSDSDGEPITITCTGCEGSDTDIFVAETNRLKEAFNEEYEGVYFIEEVPFAGVNDPAQSIPYWQRLAVAGDLPDLVPAPGYVLADLGETGELVDWAPYLAEDPEWADSFYDKAFLSSAGANGEVWGVPSFRDSIGTFYNKVLFEQAGITEFPTTWEGLLEAAEALKAEGITPIAMDGAWSTLLWWANLIGTQPGGVEFLETELPNGGFNDRPEVVQATERLKLLHDEGYVNPNAFGGDFFAADTLFVTGEAAMFANGPWEIACCINGEYATPGIYDQLGYAPFPDGGLIVVSGEGAWGSGTKDPDKLEAVLAWMKFMGSKDQQLQKYAAVGGWSPRQYDLTDEEQSIIDPLYRELIDASPENVYPHALYQAPATFAETWSNNWPAYVQGGLSTEDFLNELDRAVTEA